MSLLDKINFPEDIRKLDIRELPTLCDELRAFIIDAVSCNPGHLGASLGVVELTVAIHYVYNTPIDLLIWDVGHQAYGHKIITGRKHQFHTNRKYKGISGFPSPKESVFDAFGVGHSSTSISAAIGMAVAAKKQGEKRKVIAVIGDGSMTAGLAFEGLNNMNTDNADILIILNDNKIAIDPSAGSLREYLTDIATSKTYNKVKNDVWRILGRVNKIGPNAQSIIQRVDNAIKSLVMRSSNLFESLNIRYFGPVDGHDVFYLVKILSDIKDIEGPKLLHCITTKGKGYKHAEEDQTIWHAPGKFDIATGEIFPESKQAQTPPRYQDVFGETLIELAVLNDKIVGITPAMPTGCSLNLMMEKMPDRVYDVGIAEQHAVTFAAGLSIQGMIPYCNIYSSFAQRAYDQIVHDVAIQNLHVVFCLDRAGLVGNDGATHHGAYDIAFLRCVPNLVIASPIDELELRNMLYTAQLSKNSFPMVIRYPRGRGVHSEWKKEFEEIAIGEAVQLSQGNQVAILSIGPVGIKVKAACEKLRKLGVSVAHYNMRFVKPLHSECLHEICNGFDCLLTVEDGCLQGGFGSAILEFVSENNYSIKTKRLGIPDKFVEHGSQQELIQECGFDIESIVNETLKLLK